jgi:FKBP-type peptidyl-prolyl cis-trans isomerase SlyD
MHIANDAVVHIAYTLKNDAGEIIDQSQEGQPLAYLHGHHNIVPGLESALAGKQAGDSVEVSVSATEGYGERSDEAIFEIPRDKLPPEVEPEVGMQLAAQAPDGGIIQFRLVEIGDAVVKADANHPLAGQTLHFDVSIESVREATSEELAHGHVHGPGGHHH